ncbi:MAG: electron transfer flavoprotein beta subunit/FixA family protein [Planctomycetota bacterium]|nr:MAG: electron transfer flavoprotein beta subunit/FixA family protein [Planctomycetota bacterium]
MRQMKILVFVKQVPDTEALVEALDDSSLKVEEKFEMSFFDTLAVEEALRLKEKHGGTVTAVTVGPERAGEVLRTCLALGADSVFRIWDEALAPVVTDVFTDSLSVARVLAAVAKHLGFDLILCGKQALDDDAAAVGVMTAALLEIPFVTAVTSVKAEEGSIRVKQKRDGAEREIKCELPALLSAEKGLNEPRQPQVMKVMKAARAKIDAMDLAALKIQADAIISTVKPVSFTVPDKARSISIIEGEPADAAAELVRRLREERQAL